MSFPTLLIGTPSHARLPRWASNVAGRDFAVGDIHGCFSHLSSSLQAIGFDAFVDRLFSVGDLVDRGPESNKILEWLDKPWFHAVCGNHDFMAWRSALGMPYPAVDHKAHGGSWMTSFSGTERARLGRALRALPLALEVETSAGLVGLVHAECPFDDWREMQAVSWPSLDPASPLGNTCLWSIERYSRRYKGVVRNVRAVVHGHVVLRQPDILGNVHFIDTGGWRPGGHFTFLELETLKTISGPRAPGTLPGRKNR